MLLDFNLFFLGFFSDLFADFNLVLKIFALLTIVSYVRMHFGNSPLTYLLIIGLGWFILFDYWKFFGSVFLLFSLLMLGIAGILIDFFFVSQGITFGTPQKTSALSSGADLAARQHQLAATRQAFMGKPRTPMG